MKISGFHTSLIDYPGKLASIIFTSGCNYRCPACHAKNIVLGNGSVSEDKILSHLDSQKGFIDGVVLCGGEPTLQLDLPFFIEKLKSRNLSIKLDTNGSNPEIIKNLLENKLVDYVAMDIKGPKSLYPKLCGKEFIDFRELEKSIVLASHFPDYEFRTTIAPVIRDSEISFMKIDEAVDMARWIVQVTEKDNHMFYLQKFVPKKGELLDEKLESCPETPKSLLEEMKQAMKPYLKNVEIR